MSNVTASVGWPSGNPVVLPLDFAFIAMSNAARKPLFLKVLKAAIVVRELRIEVIYRVPQVVRGLSVSGSWK